MLMEMKKKEEEESEEQETGARCQAETGPGQGEQHPADSQAKLDDNMSAAGQAKHQNCEVPCRSPEH